MTSVTVAGKSHRYGRGKATVGLGLEAPCLQTLLRHFGAYCQDMKSPLFARKALEMRSKFAFGSSGSLKYLGTYVQTKRSLASAHG